METTHKTVLQEILSRDKASCSWADAAALHGAQPAEILSRFSFTEFNQLVGRMKLTDDSSDKETP